MLILDVNGLLLHRIYRKSNLMPDAGKMIGEFTIFLRPEAKEFVAWCRQRFNVVIWGTAMLRNIYPLLELLEVAAPGLLVLGQEDCLRTGLEHPDCPGKEILLKPLGVVKEKLREHGQLADADRFILVDDAPYKSAANASDTCISPPAWSAVEPGAFEDKTLADGGPMRDFLEDFLLSESTAEVLKEWEKDGKRFWTDPRDCAICAYIRRRLRE